MMPTEVDTDIDWCEGEDMYPAGDGLRCPICGQVAPIMLVFDMWIVGRHEV